MSEHEHVWGPRKGIGRMTALSVARGWEPSVCVVCGETDRPDSLDAAWAEAEAALPEGVRIWGVFDNAGAADTGPWQAEAWGITDGGPDFIVYGPTPAAALRALAEKLREVRG